MYFVPTAKNYEQWTLESNNKQSLSSLYKAFKFWQLHGTQELVQLIYSRNLKPYLKRVARAEVDLKFTLIFVMLILCTLTALTYLVYVIMIEFARSLIRLVLATLYPAYSTYKAIKYKDGELCSRWVMYWICYSIFTVAEYILDIFFGFWVPFYTDIKLLGLIWLVSSNANGARILYTSFIHPELNRHEELIDSYIKKTKLYASSWSTALFGRFINIVNENIYHMFQLVQMPLVNQINNAFQTQMDRVKMQSGDEHDSPDSGSLNDQTSDYGEGFAIIEQTNGEYQITAEVMETVSASIKRPRGRPRKKRD